MGLILNILIAKRKIRPLAKNLLRAVALQADFELAIRHADEEKICTSGGVAYSVAATHSLLEALAYLDADAPLTESLKLHLTEMASWLKEQTGVGETFTDFSVEEILEEVCRQSVFYTAGEPEKKFSGFWCKWREKYPYPQEFHVTGKSVVNEINRQEAGDYLKAHQESGNEAYIENAAKSLMAAIPDDVESIFDIGSGPGYIDRLIPSDYAVLAMDIDEAILAGNPRPSCVGDIMDVPLPDRSVDLVLASDVIEHLPKEVLQAGMKEMERVSRKYIYLQVPFMEDPLLAYAYCPQCGHVWHVNHHKHFFDQDRLCSLVSDEWKPVLVNYTGDVFFHRNGLIEAKLAETLGWEIYDVENVPCPQCGVLSVRQGMEHRKKLDWMTDFDVECPFPVYTEIGVLFCRADEETELTEIDGASFFEHRKRNALSFHDGVDVKSSYSRQDLLPGLYAGDCLMEKDTDAYCFHKNSKASQAWVGVTFPALPECYSEVEFEGALAQTGTVRMSMSMADGEKQSFTRWQWNEKQKRYRLALPQEAEKKPLFFKLYFEESELKLFACRLLGGKDVCYECYKAEDSGFLCFEDQNIKYRLILPNPEGMSLSHCPQAWLELTNGVSARTQDILKKACIRAVMPLSGMQELLKESARTEERIGLYKINGLANFRLFFGKMIPFFRRTENWVRRHKKIYNLLISLGVKNFYMRCKRRMMK